MQLGPQRKAQLYKSDDDAIQRIAEEHGVPAGMTTRMAVRYGMPFVVRRWRFKPTHKIKGC